VAPLITDIDADSRLDVTL